jgi:nitrite reductase/ring-hydroxylating ferredoxin subunit
VLPSPSLVRFAVRAYPSSWRRRYGVELRSLVMEHRPGWRDWLDLLVGAIDARLHPEVAPRPALAAILPAYRASEARPSAPVQAYGIVNEPPIREISRRTFMRRMLGAGVALLSLEFVGGVLAFMWPQIRGGLGGTFAIGTIADIVARQPSFAAGWPYAFAPARLFLINVPAAEELALGHEISIPNPAANQLLALWRKCPHLGCQVPELCDALKRFTCRCHGSTYNILGEKLGYGPADRGMDRFAITIGPDGVVTVDTSKITAGALKRGPDSLVFTDPNPWMAECR